MKRRLPEGHTVEYNHIRNWDIDAETNTMTRNAKGGITVATILNADGEIVLSATATCYYKDNFNKNLGRTIALGLALAELDGTKAARDEKKRLAAEAKAKQSVSA